MIVTFTLTRMVMSVCCGVVFFFFKQKTAYEMRISDWSSDVCSSDLPQESFLREAKRVEEWNGCRIGIFVDEYLLNREKVRINFHGLTVPCRLPHIHDADGGDRKSTRLNSSH